MNPGTLVIVKPNIGTITHNPVPAIVGNDNLDFKDGINLLGFPGKFNQLQPATIVNILECKIFRDRSILPQDIQTIINNLKQKQTQANLQLQFIRHLGEEKLNHLSFKAYRCSLIVGPFEDKINTIQNIITPNYTQDFNTGDVVTVVPHCGTIIKPPGSVVVVRNKPSNNRESLDIFDSSTYWIASLQLIDTYPTSIHLTKKTDIDLFLQGTQTHIILLEKILSYTTALKLEALNAQSIKAIAILEENYIADNALTRFQNIVKLLS